MSAEDTALGSVRVPRLARSPASPRPSKVRKVLGSHWSDKQPSEMEQIPAASNRARNPVVLREFVANNVEGSATFSCTSGELLWGQLNTVIEGSKSRELDTTDGPHETLTGGTIIQHNFRYKAKARKGTWKVEPAFIGDWHIGYVSYHEDVDGLELLGQAANVGISNANDHKNREVVYVNRYDWGDSHTPGLSLVLETLGLGTEEDLDMSSDEPQSEYLCGLVGKRFMLLDPNGLPTLIQALKDGERLQRKNYLLHCTSVAAPEAANKGTAQDGKAQNHEAADSEGTVTAASEPEPASSAHLITSSGSKVQEAENAGSVEGTGNGVEAVKSVVAKVDSSAPFGINLVTEHTEYELGWMLFEEGELVGFVYDGEYSALEIYPEGSEMKLGKAVVTKVDHNSEEEEDPPYTPSTHTESTDSEPDTRYYAGSETESEAGSQATSGQTAASRENQGGDEEQGEECMSKDVSSSAPGLETILEEDDVAEPSEQITVDAPQVLENETAISAAAPGLSSVS